jgi:nucleotide-binding universal stress UspA family protein
VTTAVVVNVDVAEALVQVADQELFSGGQFDLMAMATHGRSGLPRLLLGSVTEHLMNATHLPMLVVHPSGQGKPARKDEWQIVASR